MSRVSVEDQFLAAYDEHADAVFRFCYAYIGNRDHAKDAVQETFVRTWAYLARGKRIAAMKPFLYRVARNYLTDRARQAKPESLEVLQESGWDVADERNPDPAVSMEAARAIRLAARLEPAYRDAVLLRHVEGLPPRDIARLAGESENTVSVRIHRGLDMLRKLLVESPL